MTNGIDVAEQKKFIKHVSGKKASCLSKLTFHYLTKLIEKVKINPLVLLPLITLHGYIFGQPMIGAEPTPLVFYLIGLYNF